MANKLNLLLHCGAQLATLDQVKNTHTPAETKTWTPIPHAELIDKVQTTLDFNGYKIITEAHALGRDGQRYFGLMQVEPRRKTGHEPIDSGTVVGLRNSHDKAFAGGALIGDAPFVCDNLAFSGEVQLSRKHTKNIRRDLPNLVDRMIGKLMDSRFGSKRRVARYKDTDLSTREAHDLLVRAVDAQVIANAKLPHVLKAWREPPHPEFSDRNVWSFYNAFTEVMKGVSIFQKPRSSDALHGLLDSHCGIETRTAA